MNNLINRNILVTGSNKGIGKELAIGLGSQGANIILLGRNSAGLEEVYDEIQKSNMSKLGKDGKPIYRSDGKVMKGPNYFKPNIRAILKK